MTEKPWLILTLRRTGGTSLTGFLSSVSRFPTIEHEPFNVDRRFGAITTAFRGDGDVAAMEAAVGDAVADNPNIKHCIEIIPPEITRALIERAAAQDYRVMVLTRRDEARRIASLLLALATGAWGPREAAKIYPKIRAGELVPEAIDLKKVRARVSTDFFALGRTLAMLRNRRIDHDWLVFEELYFGDTPIESQARAIAARLGIEVAEDDARLAEFSAREGQKSAEIAAFVPGYEEAVTMLEKLCVG